MARVLVGQHSWRLNGSGSPEFPFCKRSSRDRLFIHRETSYAYTRTHTHVEIVVAHVLARCSIVLRVTLSLDNRIHWFDQSDEDGLLAAGTGCRQKNEPVRAVPDAVASRKTCCGHPCSSAALRTFSRDETRSSCWLMA